MDAPGKFAGSLVEYFDHGGLHPALVLRDQGERLVVRDAAGHERAVARELVLMRHPGSRAADGDAAAQLAALEADKAALRTELDLHLLWEVVQEQGRAFTAEELAELFFGRRTSVAAAVMLEALLADRIYFVRRHREFVARTAEQVERLRTQESRVRLRSEQGRRKRDLMRAMITERAQLPAAETAELAGELLRYLRNPSTRSQELTAMLAQAAPEVDPAEAAFEILDRLDAAPATPRFAAIGALPEEFGDAALTEAAAAAPTARAPLSVPMTFTIDDDDTVEVDDALSCEVAADGALVVGIHIALVADFVARGGAMDREAGARATTVYLPETTVRMLPDEISCRRASLIAGERRPVLSTTARLGAGGELLASEIRPASVAIGRRLSYAQADRILAGAEGANSEAAAALSRLYAAALELRERRRLAGALLVQRREPKVRVRGDEIEIEVLDSDSPSRILVAEFMVLSNFIAARYAAAAQIPMIYRVQPAAGDAAAVRARLSLYPEYHAGVGLACYAQLSSPIRRYADLVLQRQLVAALAAGGGAPPYSGDEILAVLANSENAESEVKELERRARRYWTLRYLERHALGRELSATVTRDGVSAELDEFAVRGALHGAPNVPSRTRLSVRIARVDPLRGWLSFDYLATLPTAADGQR